MVLDAALVSGMNVNFVVDDSPSELELFGIPVTR